MKPHTYRSPCAPRCIDWPSPFALSRLQDRISCRRWDRAPCQTSGAPAIQLGTVAVFPCMHPNLAQVYKQTHNIFFFFSFFFGVICVQCPPPSPTSPTTTTVPFLSYRGWSFITWSAIEILRIWAARYGLQLQGTRWPLVTNYQVIIPARLMSEVSVITPRQETSCARRCSGCERDLIHVHLEFGEFILLLYICIYIKKRGKKGKTVLLPVALSRLQFIWHAQVVLGAHGCNCKPHWTDVPIEGFLLLHTWAILPSWNQTQNLSLSPP